MPSLPVYVPRGVLLLVLPVRQPHDEYVKDCERNEPNRWYKRYAIELVDDKDPEKSNHPGIGPELISEQRRRQNDLHDAVGEQIEPAE